MSPQYRAKAVMAKLKAENLSDAELEAIIASAITRAMAAEREQCAFTANALKTSRRGNDDFNLGAQAAFVEMAIQIRKRSRPAG